MRPIADLSHSAYDTLEFVKQHYPEMVQMYETIMAHLKVPEAAPVAEPAEAVDTHVAYTLTDVFDTIIIDPDVIHNILGYTDEEIPIMCKRAGLKYLGLYNIEARTFNDGHYEKTESGEEWVEENYEYPARQVPMFAIIKGYEATVDYYVDTSFRTTITYIPVNHKRTEIIFTASHQHCSDEYFNSNEAVSNGIRKGILWDCSYAHQCKTSNGVRRYRRYEGFEEVTTDEESTYGTVAQYKCTDAKLYQVTTTVTTLIDVNDTIYLPEVL
jgi:hypothetical protein